MISISHILYQHGSNTHAYIARTTCYLNVVKSERRCIFLNNRFCLFISAIKVSHSSILRLY